MQLLDDGNYFSSTVPFQNFFQEIPIVIAGNKLDLASKHREVEIGDVSEWVYCELPRLRYSNRRYLQTLILIFIISNLLKHLHCTI